MRKITGEVFLNKRLIWVLFLLFSGLALYALFRPMPPVIIFYNSDKIGHIIIFLLISLTGRQALCFLSSASFWSAMIGLAFALEYLQGVFRPMRIYSVEDVYSNVIGVVIALILIKWFK